jgi:uncharacterized protein YjbJ (UPF0337 family)
MFDGGAMEDQIAGGLKIAAGRVEDVAGAATADAGLQARGKVRQLAGSAQLKVGSALDTFRENALANPLATMAVTLAVGFLLGAYWQRRD